VTSPAVRCCGRAFPCTRWPFTPPRPVLVVGTGAYDGGYFFEGELLLLNLETGEAASLIEHPLGRQVLSLQWLSEWELRMVMAPPDDWQDRDAWTEGHVAVVHRPDWGDGAAPVDQRRGPGRTAGPGVETADGFLVYAGTVYNGLGLQPGGSFVVKRSLTREDPDWVFRTDPPATDLDADASTVYVTYKDGEVAALRLGDGTVRWCGILTIAGIPAVLTAVAVAGPDRLLIGTSDGRILDCSVS
jgi:hypothetical protein